MDRQLRVVLLALAEHSDDPAFRELVTDVLEGRVSLRDAVRSPVFEEAVTPGVREFARHWSELS